jgi:nucleotide-binding universal stress UspA family protein
MAAVLDRSILVGYDGSRGAELALRWALGEAARRGADLVVLQSWHEPLISHRTWKERWDDPAAEERAAAGAVERAVDAARAAWAPAVSCTTELTDAPAAPALVAAAAQHELVVVGSRGLGGFAALTLGSVAEHVAGAAPVTVAVIGADQPDGSDVVVGVDGSIGSRRALLWAADEARVRAASLRAVLAWTAGPPIALRGAQPFGAAATEDDARLALHRTIAEQLGAAGAGDVQRVVRNAPAARALLETAEGASLLVIGAAPTDAGRNRLGSVARQVVRHAPCPVVIAR